MKKDNDSNLIIDIVKTDKGCFITDCKSISGHNYNYHNSKIINLYFNGKKPNNSFLKNWYFIDEYPTKIEKKESDERINQRYELKNPEMESKAMPLVVEQSEMEDDIHHLYELKYETVEGGIVEVDDVSFDLICEVDNFEFPANVNHDGGTRRIDFNDKKINITNENFNHQLLDKMAFPEIVLHNYPCEISSVDLYIVVRQYIKDNIDHSVSKISSDYDFCFEVKKIVPLHSPKKHTYTNPFATTKKQRNKVHSRVSEYKEMTIFSMTHDGENYKSYSPIKLIRANNHNELNEKIDKYLNDLIAYINEPLVECEHCKGLGWKAIESFD